jgi:hypothetical protein
MERLNDEDTCMSKATINILSSLGWHIHYQAKSEDQDSSHLFEDVTVYFAAYQDAMEPDPVKSRHEIIPGQGAIDDRYGRRMGESG